MEHFIAPFQLPLNTRKYWICNDLRSRKVANGNGLRGCRLDNLLKGVHFLGGADSGKDNLPLIFADLNMGDAGFGGDRAEGGACDEGVDDLATNGFWEGVDERAGRTWGFAWRSGHESLEAGAFAGEGGEFGAALVGLGVGGGVEAGVEDIDFVDIEVGAVVEAGVALMDEEEGAVDKLGESAFDVASGVGEGGSIAATIGGVGDADGDTFRVLRHSWWRRCARFGANAKGNSAG